MDKTVIDSYPRYDSYKDSRESWIGEIPKGWDVLKLKHIFYEKKHTKNMALNCGSISFGKVIKKNDDRIPHSTKSSYQEVLKGEFLINPLNLNFDLVSLRIALSEIDVVVSAGYIVLKNKKPIRKEYFKYLLHRYDVAYMKLLGSGVRQTINFNHIADSLLPVPTIKEQELISVFLDKKTAQIDQAITLKQQQITKLEEYKQIVIQNAVTKGLNPDAPMKDSGVDWIGDIPEHWEVKKLKYLGKISSGYSVINSDLKDSGLYEAFGGNGFIGYYNKYNTEGQSIIVGRVGALCGNIRFINDKKWISDNALILKLNNSLLYEHIALVLKAADLNKLNTSNAQPLITGTKVMNVEIPKPTMNEIDLIDSYIKNFLLLHQNTLSNYKAQIDRLKEYKTILINQAVTGKIKIS